MVSYADSRRSRARCLPGTRRGPHVNALTPLNTPQPEAPSSIRALTFPQSEPTRYWTVYPVSCDHLLVVGYPEARGLVPDRKRPKRIRPSAEIKVEFLIPSIQDSTKREHPHTAYAEWNKLLFLTRSTSRRAPAGGTEVPRGGVKLLSILCTGGWSSQSASFRRCCGLSP